MSFSTFQLPTRIIIGSGSIGCAPDELRAIEVTKPLLVTDPGIAYTEVFEDIRVVLDEAGIPFEVFKDVEAQPSARTVEDAFSLYERSECDGLLALGGGSSIDTAKGAAILATNGGKPQDYDGFDKYSAPPAPLVAIPTTAGTGSEVSYAASISDTDRGIKFTIRHSQLNRAKVAILDPDVLRTLPRHTATVTGMDALTHAVESYTSLEATPITEAASLYATELIGTHLRPFVANRGNGEAAKSMLVASSLAAIAFSDAGLGNAHCLARTLAAKFRMEHGMSCAVTLPYVVKFNAMANPSKFARVASALGTRVEGLTQKEAADKAASTIFDICLDLGIPSELNAFGVQKKDVSYIAEQSMKAGYNRWNPYQMTNADFERLLSQMVS